MSCDFSFAHYEHILRKALRSKYAVFCLGDFVALKRRPKKVLLLRHDIDFVPERAVAMAAVEKKLGVKATYFVRVHADYNPFNFRVWSFLDRIRGLGHEIGLHHENLDFAVVSGRSAASVIASEKKVLEAVTGFEVRGCAAHNDFTPSNNLEFWKKHSPKEFGFKYEAYGPQFKDFTYVSDSLGKWRGGKCPCNLMGTEDAVYLSTHPNYWYLENYHTF